MYIYIYIYSFISIYVCAWVLTYMTYMLHIEWTEREQPQEPTVNRVSVVVRVHSGSAADRLQKPRNIPGAVVE